jgi:CRISPR/Cas system-associated exonuclease Cas4 (RecB family)
MIDHISISQINTFSMCELQYYYRYIMGLKSPPKAALTIGSAVHKGTEKIYLDIADTGRYLASVAMDVTRDHIAKDTETDWEGITPNQLKEEKGIAVDRATKMVKAYSGSGYPDTVHQEDVEGVEVKCDKTLKSDGCNTPPRIIGFTDLILKDRIVDFKTSGRSQSKATGGNVLQNGFYAYAFGKPQSEIHHMSCNAKGTSAKAVEFSVPMLPEETLLAMINNFWYKLMDLEISGNWMATGMTHQWACSFCGYGRTGKCPFALKVD